MLRTWMSSRRPAVFLMACRLLDKHRPQIALTDLARVSPGYVLKSQSSSELLDAIRTVAIGIPYVAPEIVEKLASDDSSAKTEALSRREHDVCRQLVSGYRSRAIARNLSISLKTVETHRASINRKLAVTTTADLIRFAVERGMPVVPRISSERVGSNEL
jgi:two-component system, NarL family, nitrate/nitrite response regulator NarL